MKLSEKTRLILDNFASINEGMLILEGKTQKTMSLSRSILATAVLDEEFPKEVGVYYLPKLLQIISLFKDPDLEFGDKKITFTEGEVSATYTYCEPSLIKHPPKDKDLPFGEVKVAFTLTKELFASVQKASKILGNPDLVVQGKDGKLLLIVKDNKNSSADTFVREVGEATEDFTYSFDSESLKIIQSDYDVQIDGRLAKFASKELEITYWAPTQKV